MRITKIHIAGFGALADAKFSFSNGVNTVCRENGFGKSTLVGFIKAMLYGFSETKKHSLSENDRKKYLPWNGGVCGGSLTIETKSGVFRIERTFGEKPSADTLRVYDEENGLECRTLGKVPGHTLFGIDAEGFMQTLCLGEQSFHEGVKNESVSDLLSRTASNGATTAGIDEAIALLQKQQKQLQKRGGRGEIAALGERISHKRARIMALEESAASARALSDRLKEERATLEQKQNELRALISEDARLLSHEQAMREREQKHRRLEQINDTLRVLEQRLGSQIEPEQIDRIQRLEGRLDSLRQDAENADRLRERFEGKLTREELNMQTSVYNSIDTNKNTDEVQAFWHKHPELRGEAFPTLQELRAYQKRKKRLTLLSLWCALFVIGSLLILCAGGVSTLLYPIGAAMMLFSILPPLLFPIPKQKRSVCERIARTLMGLKGIAKREIPSLFEERERIIALEREIGENERKTRELWDFLSRFDIREQDLSLAMESLQSLFSSYEQQKSEKYKQTFSLLQSYREEIDAFYLQYRTFGAPPYTALRQAIFEKDALIRERDELSLALSSSPAEDPSELNEIRLRKDTLAGEIRELELSLARGGEELSRLEEAAETVDDERYELHALCARRDEYEKRLEILEKTEQYLSQAKKSMETSYLGVTRECLHRVLDTLGVVDASHIRLNQQLEILREENGLCRPRSAFSRGEQDLYRLAMRLALIDTLYGAEDRPPIIFDDPFAAFDDARLEQALFYLRALGRDTQILYMTCTSARC